MNCSLKTEIIKEYIKNNALTVKEFCSQCGISVSTYYRMMHGKDFYLNSLLSIAKKLNKRLMEFF